MPEYTLLQDYAWKGGRINIYTWQEEGTTGKTKVYDYTVIKNGQAYSVIFALPIASDKATESTRNILFNSVEVSTQQQTVTA